MPGEELALTGAPPVLWRIGRPPAVFSWRQPETLTVPPDSVEAQSAGARWDDPDEKWATVYCGDSPIACAFERLAPLHPNPDAAQRVLEATSDELPDPGFDPQLYTGAVNEREFRGYAFARVEVAKPAPFIDVGDPRTHRLLTLHIPHVLRYIDAQRFDRAVVMHANRRVTREIASFLRAFTDASEQRVAGIRYESRVAQHHCYALWEDRLILGVEQHRPITRHSPELKEAAAQLGIAIGPDPDLGPATAPTPFAR